MAAATGGRTRTPLAVGVNGVSCLGQPIPDTVDREDVARRVRMPGCAGPRRSAKRACSLEGRPGADPSPTTEHVGEGRLLRIGRGDLYLSASGGCSGYSPCICRCHCSARSRFQLGHSSSPWWPCLPPPPGPHPHRRGQNSMRMAPMMRKKNRSGTRQPVGDPGVVGSVAQRRGAADDRQDEHDPHSQTERSSSEHGNLLVGSHARYSGGRLWSSDGRRVDGLRTRSYPSTLSSTGCSTPAFWGL